MCRFQSCCHWELQAAQSNRPISRPISDHAVHTKYCVGVGLPAFKVLSILTLGVVLSVQDSDVLLLSAVLFTKGKGSVLSSGAWIQRVSGASATGSNIEKQLGKIGWLTGKVVYFVLTELDMLKRYILKTKWQDIAQESFQVNSASLRQWVKRLESLNLCQASDRTSEAWERNAS